MLAHCMMVLHGLKYCTRYGINTVVWDMGYVTGMVYGKNTVLCGMVCVDGMVREKHSIWYGTFAVWFHGTVSWMY